MMRIQRDLAGFLALLLMTTMLPMQTLAAFFDNATEITNEYIMVSVNNKNGRYAIRTKDGQPIRKKDQNSDLTFTKDDTSFTSFKINGTDYIFGNSYKFTTSEGTKVESKFVAPKVVENEDGSKEILTKWSIEGVDITQSIKLFHEEELKDAGNALVSYTAVNNSGANLSVGSRVLLDVMVGNNDGPAFQNGTISENLITVERTLKKGANIGDVIDGTTITENNLNYYDMKSFWVVKDTVDPKDPLATNIYAYGFNNFSDTLNIADRLVVGHWNHLANSIYDFEVNPNLDFTTDTNDYGTADSALAFYWDAKNVDKQQSRTFQVTYGLGEIVEDKSVFNIQFMDQVMQMQTNDANTKYLGDGVFQVTVQIGRAHV